MGQPTHFTSKGKQITRPQRECISLGSIIPSSNFVVLRCLGGDEYRMQKMTQSVDNLQRPYGNGVRGKRFSLFRTHSVVL